MTCSSEDEEAQRFWLKPPWTGGQPIHRMGLQRIDRSAWLPVLPPELRAQKLAVLHEHETQCYGLVPGWKSAVSDAVAQVRAMRGTGGATPDPERPPLQQLALETRDDLCLLATEESAFPLIAACVCAPSYWSLPEKLGLPLLAIHEPVPGLAARIGAVMLRFLTRLRQGEYFERRNWFLHHTAERYQPAPDDGSRAEGACWIRTERQTFTRLNAANILFTIDVTFHALDAIRRYPAAARDMLRAFEAMDKNEREHFGFDDKVPEIMPLLTEASQAAS